MMSVPKLRFKKFREDWKTEQINNVISNKSQKYDPVNSKEDLPCIELEHLSQLTGVILGSVSSMNQKSIKNRFDEKSVLFGKLRPYLKKYAQPEFKGVCSSEIWVLTSSELVHTFLFQYIQTEYFNQLANIQTGSKMPRSDWNYFAEEDIYYPALEEQTKIASFLSAVDKKITQLSCQHELLQQYKQGMMQQLFSQKLRFKDDKGEDFPDWMEKKLNDLSKRITRKNSEDNQNVLTISAQKGLVSQQEYFSKKVASRNLQGYYLLENGEYAYNKSYSVGYPMGAIKRLRQYDKGVVSTLYICFSLGNLINSDFFEQYVESGKLNIEIEKIAQEGARNHGLLNVSVKDFFDIDLNIPCLEEQTKIAHFLTEIDNKINITAKQLQQARDWKQGLLQQMFV